MDLRGPVGKGGNMACSNPKKIKRSKPVPVLNAKERVRQFPHDLYEDGEILFCKFCNHSLDFVRVDTVKDHLKSKKHTTNKVGHFNAY